MPTRIAEKPVDVADVWFTPLAADPAGAVAFLAEVTGRVSRRRGRVLVLGDRPVADGLAGEGFAVIGASGDLPTGLRFDVVLAGANELSRLLVQRDQLRLIRRLTALLRPGGALVVSGRHPDPAGWAAGALVTEHDCVRQLVVPAGARLPRRYVWPAELDLMAELAELALDSRWGGWYGEPVVCGGPVVSVFRS
jgi:hypothetical protein